MALKGVDKVNFNSLLQAASNGDLGLMQCKDIKTGEYVAVMCAKHIDDDGMVVMTPLAKMFGGNPYLEVAPDDGDDGVESFEPEYVDDWHCRSCNEGPFGDETNYCPNCGQKHNQDDEV